MMRFDLLPPISLLAGSGLTEVVAREHDWLFGFGGGLTVVAESHWRLVTGDRVIVTDRDHGQLFGFKEPADAAEVVRSELEHSQISQAEFSPVSDLILRFSNGCALQMLVGSAGHENWHVYGPDGSHAFAAGGGELGRVAP